MAFAIYIDYIILLEKMQEIFEKNSTFLVEIAQILTRLNKYNCVKCTFFLFYQIFRSERRRKQFSERRSRKRGLRFDEQNGHFRRAEFRQRLAANAARRV